MAKYYYSKYSANWYVNDKIYTSADKRITSQSEIEFLVSQFTMGLFIITKINKSFVETNLNNVKENELYAILEEDKVPPIAGQEIYVFYYQNNNFYGITENVTIESLEMKKDEFLESIKAEDGEFPNNGIHTDGFYYVKGDKASIPINTNINGTWKETESAHVNVNGAWKEIKEAYQMQNGIWVKLWQGKTYLFFLLRQKYQLITTVKEDLYSYS